MMAIAIAILISAALLCATALVCFSLGAFAQRQGRTLILRANVTDAETGELFTCSLYRVDGCYRWHNYRGESFGIDYHSMSQARECFELECWSAQETFRTEFKEV